MRTEVKIGLVVCVVIAGLVGLYMAFSGGTAEDTAPAEPSTVATNDPAVPARPDPAPTGAGETVGGRPRPRSATPVKRTPLSLDLTPFGSAAKPKTGARSGAVANRTQRVPTRSVPGLKLGSRGVQPTSRPIASAARPALSLAGGATSSGQPRRKPVSTLTLPSRSSATTPRTYTVKATDTAGYWGISKTVYGESRYAYLISKANPTVNPKRLRPGQKLKILPLPTTTVAGNAKRAASGSAMILPSGDRQYVIASGDTCTGLAKRFYGDIKYVDVIIKANPDVNPDKLQIGQKMVIPRRTGSPSSALRRGATVAAQTPGPGQKVYTIADGDLLSKIATREYGSSGLWPAILKANPGLNPRRLVPGKKILLPSKAEATRLAGAAASASTASAVSASSASVSSSTGYVPGKPYFGDD